MRIDSSGNLLVGQTTASSGTVGTSLRSDGRNFFCADGNYSAHFNRKTSDGDIAHFAKDDTIVGSIGTNGGYIYVGSGDTNLRFHAGSDAILPANAGGATRSAAIDLGTSGAKFRHLHFSGGLYGGSELQLSRVGLGTVTASSIAVNSSNTEGLFFHNSTNDYYMGRTPGSWTGPNYQQLEINWDTGVIIDGGTAYGKSGVEINGPIKSSHGGMVLQTLEAYNNTAISTSGSGVVVVESATFPVFANSRIAVWFNSGQVSNPGNASNPNFDIQWVNSGGTSTSISDQNSNHYWYDIGKNSGARVNMVGQALSGLLNADTYKIRVVGNVYNGTATWNYQAQGAHLLIQEISAG